MTPEISKALVVAQSHARALPKDAKNKYHDYKYTSAESIIEEGRASLNAAGLALMPIGRRGVVVIVGETAERRVELKYQLVHESGATEVIESSTPVIPEKGRPVDKAEAAAATSDLAYTLRTLLLLPRDDEAAKAASIDGRDDRGYDPDAEQRPAEGPGVRRAEPPARTAAPEPTSAASRAEPPPPQRTPATQAQPADDPAHVALAEELFRQAKDPSIDPSTVYDAIIGANLPSHLETAPLVEMFVRTLPAVTTTLPGWIRCLRSCNIVAPVFTASLNRAQNSAEVTTWLGIMKACELPKESPERTVIGPVLDAAVKRTGWTPPQRQAA